MEIYRHRQFGLIIVISMSTALILMACIFIYRLLFSKQISVMEILFFPIAALILLAAVFFFKSLLIIIDESGLLTVRFGLIKRSIDLKKVLSCEAAAYPWYYGWGIRLTNKGWLYTASGNKGVKIKFKNGTSCMLGSDEPEILLEVMKRFLQD